MASSLPPANDRHWDVLSLASLPPLVSLGQLRVWGLLFINSIPVRAEREVLASCSPLLSRLLFIF